MESAVIYARYSSHNQTENSIEGQVAAAEAYAASHGYTITHVYADRAKTGTNDQREEFQRMLADTKKHEFSVIIVWKVDRFGRNREEITFNKYKCKKEGVRVEYVAEQLGEGNESVILESVLEGMAEYYSKQLSTNVKRGLLENAKKGKYTGGPAPFGYKVADGRLVPNEDAKIVKQAFEDYVSGMEVKELVKKNNITQSRFYDIIRNKKYKGEYKLHDVVIPIEPIVSEELWNAAHNKVRKLKPKTKSDCKYLLTGKLYHEDGNKYVGRTGGHKKGDRYRYYVSDGHKPIRKENIEGDVLDALQDILSSSEAIQNIIDGVYNSQNIESSKLSQLNKELNAVEKKYNNLLKALEDGAPYVTLKDRLYQLEQERTEIEKQIEGEKNISHVVLTKDMIKEYLTDLPLISSKELYVNKFVDRVIVYDDRTDLKIKCYDSLNLEMSGHSDLMRTFSIKRLRR